MSRGTEQTDPASLLQARVTEWRSYAEDVKNNPCILDAPGLRFPAPRWKSEGQVAPHGGRAYPGESPPDDPHWICQAGDSVLYNALLGYSGEPLGWDAVRRSQDGSGRWWRSPLHDYPGSRSSFSKDHAIGVLLYLVTSPDKQEARRQAKLWMNYIKTNGKFEFNINVAKDILERYSRSSVWGGYWDSTSGEDCFRTHFIDVCVEFAEEDREQTVWERVRDAVFPFWRWTEVTKVTRVKIPEYLKFATNSICPDQEAGYCQLSLELWQLMYRIWTDHLGLAPSQSMTFANDLFAAAGGNMDRHLALSASGHGLGIINPRVETGSALEDYELHLAAVHALIRCLLGENCSESITFCYSQDPENLFFQYLMHRFVNPNMHPVEEIRASLLDPSVVPATLYARNEAGLTVGFAGDGTEWCWKPKSRPRLQGSMGWDLIFLANLLMREFTEDLDVYKRDVLPALLRDSTRTLEMALAELAAAYAPLEQNERQLKDFLGQSAALLEDPEVTFDELEVVRDEATSQLQRIGTQPTRRLRTAHAGAQLAFDRLSEVQRDSRRRFQDAANLAEHTDLWSTVLAPFAGAVERIRSIREYLGSTSLSARLAALLTAIPLRIEREKLEGTNQVLREVADEVVANLREVAKEREYAQIQEEVVGRVASLVDPLRHARFRRRLGDANSVAEELDTMFEGVFERVMASTALLTDAERTAIRDEAYQIVATELGEWQELLNQFGAEGIVQGRLDAVNRRARLARERVLSYPEPTLRVLCWFWIQGVRASGYRISEACLAGGPGGAINPSCWQFVGPEGSGIEGWSLFDAQLGELEKIIDAFLLLPQGRPERAATTEHAEPTATGVVIDVNAEGTCAERVNTPEGGILFRSCRVPQRMVFKAAPVTSSYGNRVIEGLTFFNHISLVSNGGAFNPFTGPVAGSFRWRINGSGGGQPLGIGEGLVNDFPVPYGGSEFEVEAVGLDEWTVFAPSTRVEMVSNYIYPDLKSDSSALRVYARSLGRYARFTARTYRELAPDRTSVEVVAALDDGSEMLDALLDFENLDPLTQFQMTRVRDRMRAGKDAITRDCGGGASLCPVRIAEVRQELAGFVEEATGELQSLQRFLDGEIARLTGVDNEAVGRLRQLITLVADNEHTRLYERIVPWNVLRRRRSIRENVSTLEEQFVRGVEATYTGAELDDLLRNAQAASPGNFRVEILDPNTGVMTGQWLCTGRYAGLVSGMPHFTSIDDSGCGIHIRQRIADEALVQRIRSAGQTLLIRLAAKGGAVPVDVRDAHGNHAFFSFGSFLRLYSSKDVLWHNLSSDRFRKTVRENYQRNDSSWFDYNIMNQVDLTPDTQEVTDLCVELHVSGSEIHNHHIRWQLLNPVLF